MSSEHLLTPGDILNEIKARNERFAIIGAIESEVNEKLMELTKEELPCLDDTRNALEWNASMVLKTQLRSLSAFVLDRARNEDYDPRLDLDDTQFEPVTELLSEIYESEFFTLNKEESIELLRQKEAEATSIFLEIMAPDNIKDPRKRSIHLLPWRRDLMSEITAKEGCEITPNDDGILRLSRATRLSNTPIDYTYLPSEKPELELPLRSLRLRK